MKQITVQFKDEVTDADIQQYAGAALTIPGVTKVTIGVDSDAKKEVINDLLWALFKGGAGVIPAPSNPASK